MSVVQQQKFSAGQYPNINKCMSVCDYFIFQSITCNGQDTEQSIPILQTYIPLDMFIFPGWMHGASQITETSTPFTLGTPMWPFPLI
jgi:hypothetical protein